MNQTGQYIRYGDDQEVAYLDRNVYDSSKTVIFPRHLYGGQAHADAQYICSRPRDTEINYIINRERDSHPDHFSRFGYARCENGYCSGHWPGRYNENAYCNQNEMPVDMAPARFYGPLHQGEYSVESRGIEDYHWARDYLMY